MLPPAPETTTRPPPRTVRPHARMPATVWLSALAPSARASTVQPSTTSAWGTWIPHCEPVAVSEPEPISVRFPHTSMPHREMSTSSALDSTTVFCPVSVTTRSPSAPMASPA